MLILDGDPVAEECGIYVNSLYLSIFYLFYLIKERAVDTLEKQSREERDPDLKVDEDVRLCGDR